MMENEVEREKQEKKTSGLGGNLKHFVPPALMAGAGYSLALSGLALEHAWFTAALNFVLFLTLWNLGWRRFMAYVQFVKQGDELGGAAMRACEAALNAREAGTPGGWEAAEEDLMEYNRLMEESGGAEPEKA